tara:strand:- start:90 stop:395 length:306 start_codon:yes stop_codon:yes gene_type:complete
MKTFLLFTQQILLLLILIAILSGCSGTGLVKVRTDDGEVPMRYDRETNCQKNYSNEEDWLLCMNSDNDKYYDPYYKERHEKRKLIKENIVAWHEVLIRKSY